MRKFLQVHLLTSYPPSNLNRDDLGRPKTAVIGGTNRLRISSQSLKRAWRTSSVFQEQVGSISTDGNKLGIRTKRIGRDIYKNLTDGGIDPKKAVAWTRRIVKVFGKPKDEKIEPEIKKIENTEAMSPQEKEHKINELRQSVLDIEQLAFISPEEQDAVSALTESLINEKKEPTEEQLKLLKSHNSAADIALFGRMLAEHPMYNIEAAAQVAHAFSVQKVTIEDDFFTAVDDLNRGEVEVGAGHMGDLEFASGVFYLYLNVDRDLLLENLNGAGANNRELFAAAIKGIVEAAATVSPSGKQKSFASVARAHYIMLELGNQQPRSLSLAYVDPVWKDMLVDSVNYLEQMHTKMAAVYGPCSDETKVLNVISGEGTLQELLEFATID